MYWIENVKILFGVLWEIIFMLGIAEYSCWKNSSEQLIIFKRIIFSDTIKKASQIELKFDIRKKFLGTRFTPKIAEPYSFHIWKKYYIGKYMSYINAYTYSSDHHTSKNHSPPHWRNEKKKKHCIKNAPTGAIKNWTEVSRKSHRSIRPAAASRNINPGFTSFIGCNWTAANARILRGKSRPDEEEEEAGGRRWNYGRRTMIGPDGSGKRV